MVGGGYLLQDNKKRGNNMGFDLYGLNPEGDVPQPVVTDWENTKQVDDYLDYQQDTPGSYYRANVWWWRPIWQYVCENCDNILTEKDMESGNFNDGHIISKTKAKRIASRIRKLDKQGKIMEYELEHKQYIKSLPQEDCDICEGTGVREDEIGKKAREVDEEYKCNGCQGKGVRDNWQCHYPFESQPVIEFAEFCEQSGGFEIC